MDRDIPENVATVFELYKQAYVELDKYLATSKNYELYFRRYLDAERELSPDEYEQLGELIKSGP